MPNEKPSWNTYDPLGMNRIVRFPELYEIRLSVFAPEQGSYTSKFYFLEHLSDVGNVLRADCHAADCSYACARFSFAGFTFDFECAATVDGGLNCCVKPIAVADPLTMIIVEMLRAWELGGDVALEADATLSFPSASGGRVRVAAMQETCSVHNPGTPVSSGVYSSEEEYIESLHRLNRLNGKCGVGKLAALAFTARIPLRVTACAEHDASGDSPREVAESKTEIVVQKAKRDYEEQSPAIKGGPFEGCYRAVRSVMNWMTVWDQLHEIPYAPVSRSWIDNYMVRIGFDRATRGPLTGLWDSFFHAMLQSVNNQMLAEANLRVVLGDHAVMQDGYPPNYMVSTFVSGDRSQPPLGALAAWKLYRRYENLAFLDWVYPRLWRWRQWWKTRRDGNTDGLLEWGSSIETGRPGNDAGTLFAAKCESGMDNSPLYDDAGYEQDIGTMNLSDVGLNALFAADAFYLARIADALGKTSEKKALEGEYRKLSELMDAQLWNPGIHAYTDRFWNGQFSSRIGPTMFYPLLARIPNSERATVIVQEHLLNENEFWGEHVIPSISRTDQAFTDQLYWRGRIWPPVNYLAYLGLRTYGFDEVAHELACRSVRLFMREWELRGHCHENYNAITGEADDVPVPSSPGSNGSDRFYPWGALLALMGIEELFDTEMAEGIRFGCRFLSQESRISNVPLGKYKYDITASSKETRAFREGREFFFSEPGTNVRHYSAKGDTVTFAASGAGATTFRICEFASSTEVVIQREGREIARTKSDDEGGVTFTSDLGACYQGTVLKGALRDEIS